MVGIIEISEMIEALKPKKTPGKGIQISRSHGMHQPQLKYRRQIGGMYECKGREQQAASKGREKEPLNMPSAPVATPL
ncbi:MAG: hypothetical protein BGO99_07560 [Nitrosospira sp. 56-18]|jgi:hypothetical protein|nr:MAG: hypothetical protein BGO99_07560 [Nitrosospira sp. 56-18]